MGLGTTKDGSPVPFARFPIGTRFRILPTHADMTAAAYEEYFGVDGAQTIIDRWQRTNRW